LEQKTRSHLVAKDLEYEVLRYFVLVLVVLGLALEASYLVRKVWQVCAVASGAPMPYALWERGKESPTHQQDQHR
jgi:hypothetical protein